MRSTPRRWRSAFRGSSWARSRWASGRGPAIARGLCATATASSSIDRFAPTPRPSAVRARDSGLLRLDLEAGVDPVGALADDPIQPHAEITLAGADGEGASGVELAPSNQQRVVLAALVRT